MLTSPREIFIKAHELKQKNEEFILATVVAMHGATSAKTGSKAIFDSQGKNILGWVGGGCAESFLARQALESLKERRPQIVKVDLDDEVFGLMPCGGHMDVYLEPHFPAPSLRVDQFGEWHETVMQLFHQMGFATTLVGEKALPVSDPASAFVAMANILSRHFARPLRPLREVKGQRNWPVPQLPETPSAMMIFGQSRITEELSRLAKFLGWSVIGNPPVDTEFPSDCWVIVASHRASDHELIARALGAGVHYVGFVASERRTKLVIEDLQRNGMNPSLLHHFFASAGLAMPTETPTQIAFSILCEILYCQGRFAEDLWT